MEAGGVESQERLEGFSATFGITEVAGAMAVILITIWAGHYRGGFSWSSNPDLQFNWHPVLMTLGLIYLYGNSIMLYRAMRNNQKRRLKLGHMIIHTVAFVLAVIALKAVFDSHNLHDPPIPNLYSIHSWIGLSTVILFCCQWVSGFVVFLFPGLHATVRGTYLPVHVFFGLLGFVLAVVAALLGISEKANWVIHDISDLPPEGILVNFIAITLIIFASMVVYLVTEPRFKRLPRPEDELLLSASTFE